MSDANEAPAHFGPFVGQYGVALHDVMHNGIAQHNSFSRYPLVTIIGFGVGVDAVFGPEFSIHVDLCTGRTEVSRMAFPLIQSAQQL